MLCIKEINDNEEDVEKGIRNILNGLYELVFYVKCEKMLYSSNMGNSTCG